MELAVLNIKGKETGRKVTLDDSIFGIEPNDHAIYLDTKQFLANQRQGTHKSKERGEVAGSTRKIKGRREPVPHVPAASKTHCSGEADGSSARNQNITGSSLTRKSNSSQGNPPFHIKPLQTKLSFWKTSHSRLRKQRKWLKWGTT